MNDPTATRIDPVMAITKVFDDQMGAKGEMLMFVLHVDTRLLYLLPYFTQKQ